MLSVNETTMESAPSLSLSFSLFFCIELKADLSTPGRFDRVFHRFPDSSPRISANTVRMPKSRLVPEDFIILRADSAEDAVSDVLSERPSLTVSVPLSSQ